MEIQTYCERCGNTFSARYDQTRQCLTVYCEPCEQGEITLATRDFLALPEAQQHLLQRLVERTAERNGEPVPTMTFAVTETQAQDAPSIQPLDFRPASGLRVDKALAYMVGEIARVLGLSPAELGKPALPPIEIPPGTSPEVAERMQRLADTMALPVKMPMCKVTLPPLKIDALLVNGPLIGAPPVNQLSGLSAEDLQRKIALLRRCRQGNDVR